MKVAIIGAGITGLVAGYRLLQAGHEVTIFEKEKELGGLLGSFKIEGKGLEKAYHHIFKTDKYIIELIEDLGLSSKLKWFNGSTAIYFGKKMWPFNGAIDLLHFKPLNIFDKVRLGLVKIYLEKEKKWQKFENVLAYQWMKKWCGERAYEIIWEPLLKGKFANRYQDISMAWLWARIHTRANSSEKGGEKLGYLMGGFGQIIKELKKRIKKLGGEIKLNTKITNYELRITNYDTVISSEALLNVDYLGAITAVFSSTQNLSKFYWHNITDPKSPFVAMIQHTNLVPSTQYQEKQVYYLGTYLPQNHRYFKVDDKIIWQEFFDYLKKILPDFDKKQISEKNIFKFKYAQHIVDANYQHSIINYQKTAGKIINVNFANIYPEDRGINFGVREGEKVAKKADVSSLQGLRGEFSF
ncbi:MAG: FAD-dependent oxidoreductase [Patescibacteria group bacterium]